MYKIFLQEGKKEDAIKNVKALFPNDAEDIEKVFDQTSDLGVKYIPFIERETKAYLIDQQFPLDEFIYLLNRMISYFDENVDRITPQVIGTVKELWDGTESRGVPKLDNLIKSPKDINSYTLGTLRYLRDALSMITSAKEREREAKKEAEKIFESGDVIAVRAITHNASCYYGSGTRWCTAGQQPDYFNKYSRDGKLIYFIDRSNRRQKIALYIRDRHPQVFDAADREHGIEFLYHVYPEVEDFVNEKLLGGGQVKQGLEGIKNGEIERWDASSFDPLIYTYDRDNQGNITLRLDFDNNLDYWDLFDWNEGDGDKMYLDMALSSYGSPEFFDSYIVEEDWREGYLFSQFDDKQMEELQKLMKIINPKLYKCTLKLKEWEDENCKSKVAEFLEVTFEREVAEIISEYTYDMNNDAAEGIREYLSEDYSNMFEKYGLPMTGSYYRKSVSFDDLMNAYRKYNPNFNLPIYSLLRRIIDVEAISPPDIADSIYEFRGSGYDYTATYNAIEKLLSAMQEYVEEFGAENNEDYVNHYDFIQKLGGFDTWVVVPGDERYDMKITDIDVEDSKVTFEFRNHELRTKIKKMRLPFEKFKDFIYNLQLF